jgi:hypothetical protein
MVRPRSILAVAVLCLIPASAGAQVPDDRGLAVDASGGYAAFLDESLITHATAGAALRWRLSPRFSIGPEVVFMQGPGGDRDLFLTGKAIVDFMPRRRASPYFIADGGVMLHRDDFLHTGGLWSGEGAVSAGIGMRISVTRRLSLGPEVRIGWEPHLRVGGVLTWNK